VSADARSLVRRALAEHRHLVILLTVALVLNVLAYAFFVYPLSDRVNSVAERTRAAEAELARARDEHTRAAATLTGRAQATRELDEFYRKVLPTSFVDARRLVAPRLERMASAAGVRPRGTNTQRVSDDDTTLAQVKVGLELVGTYPGIRRFIHDLEQAPEFMTIDHISLSEQGDDGRLAVSLELTTYYRDQAQ
jgi:Tfp pilus assembly protein PilO